MMLRFASFLFLAVAVVAPNPLSWRAAEVTTNRERLARNLPPLPPKFGRTLPGYARSVDDPTHAHIARASASPLPSAPPIILVFTGRIEVRNPKVNSTNSTLGFLQNTASGINRLKTHTNSTNSTNSTVGYVTKRGRGGYNRVVLSTGEDLHVTFNTSGSGKGPFDIVAKNPNFTGPVFLGGETTNPSPILSANSGATVDFENVEHTPPRSRPVKGPDGFEESSIWSIDPQTNEITAHWINPDGSPAPTIIAYDIQKDVIFFSGNIDLYNHANHTDAILVEFFLISD